MSLFGKKKLSLDEILKGIETLSEEEKAKVLAVIQGANEPVKETESAPVDEEAVGAEETADTANAEDVAEVTSGDIEDTEASEGETFEPEPPVKQTENEAETGDEVASEEIVEEIEPDAETPMEAPQADAESAGNNYEELFAAQNARIESLSSEITALKELVEKVINNQDNQNFGYSPKANFDEDISASRMDAVMQSYAPRRAEQYK